MVNKTIVLALILFAALPAKADPYSPEDLNWLKKIVTATRQSDYTGTFIYQSGSYLETSRITHIRDGENEYERLEGLDGERSEVIRKNDQVWCYLGDSKAMVAKRDGARTFPVLLPDQLELLQENYRISRGEDDRVAGYHAHSILFYPRDQLRYAHKLWVYSDSGMLLKAAVLDDNERVIDQYVFTQLQIGGDIDRKWIRQDKSISAKTQEKANDKAVVPNLRPVPIESGWSVYAVPPGFRKIAELSRYMRGSELPVIHLVYSDGLAGISVFIEKIGQKHVARTGLYNKGVTHVYTKLVDGNLLTVVGEVPPRTVMQVADSVRYGGVRK